MSINLNLKQTSEVLNVDAPRTYSIDLTNYTDLGDVGFTLGDLGITDHEDFAVIKAHDGYYYGFLSDFSGAAHNKIMYVKSSTYTFDSLIAFGTAYNVADRRPSGKIEYDPIAEKYYLICGGVYSIETTKANFPIGWGNEVTLLTVGGGGAWDDDAVALSTPFSFGNNLSAVLFDGRANAAPPYLHKIGLAYAPNNRTAFVKSASSPVYTISTAWAATFSSLRGMLQFGDVGIIAFEGRSNGKWSVGFLTVKMGDVPIIIEHPSNPIFDDSLAWVPAGNSVANPYFLNDRDQYRSGEFIMYHDYRTNGVWDKIRVLKYTSS